MNEIIVPLDGSRLSEQALGFAHALGRVTRQALHLLYVVEPAPFAWSKPTELGSDQNAAAQYLTTIADRTGDGVSATTVRFGNPVQEILSFISERGASMVVLATHGRGGLTRLMLGSVADKVVRGASVPVGLVRPPDGETPPVVALDRLLLPLDGSDQGERALPFTIQLAQHGGGHVHLVQVVEPLWTKMYAAGAFDGAYLDADLITETEAALREDARVYLEGVVARLDAAGVTATMQVRYGRPASEILDEATVAHADVIVMASHGRGGIVRFALGSVTQEVLYTSRLPMLVVPPGLSASEGT